MKQIKTICAAFLVSMAAVAAASLTARPVHAEIVLKFATVDVPQAQDNIEVLHPWADKINKEAHGLFSIQLYDGGAIANQSNVYDQVVNDVVQIAWGLPAAAAGKFRLLQVAESPFVASGDSEIDSVALWRLYKSGLLDKEFDQVVPLQLIIFPTTSLYFRQKPQTLEDLKGLKIIALSRTQSVFLTKLGAAPISFRLDEAYVALQRSAADGIATAWPAFQPFKLGDVTHSYVEAPLGSGDGYIFMARKQWNALPEGVQKILAENSGEAASRAFGKFWNRVAQEGREATLKRPGYTQLHLTAAQAEDWHNRLAPVADEWAKSVPGGDKVLASYRQFISDAKAGK